jgi:hypothetical protein
LLTSYSDIDAHLSILSEAGCLLQTTARSLETPVPTGRLTQARDQEDLYRSGRSFDQKQVDAAVAEILGAADPETMAAIGMCLAVHHVKGDGSSINAAGLTLLRAAPDGLGRQLAQRCAESCRASYEQPDVEKVLRELGGKTNRPRE